MVNFDLPAAWILTYLLVLARVAGLMIFAPFLGSPGIPALIRVALSVGLSLALFPVVQDKVPAVAIDSMALLPILAGELVMGIALGLVGQLFASALQVAGHLIGFQMGFGIINIIDPQTQVESSVISLFQNLVGILVFLAIDAHHWFIQAITDSYDIVGPQAIRHSAALTNEMIRLGGQMFVVGFKLAAPVVIVLIIVDIVLGIIGRAAPQIHILIVGMPLKTLAGFVFMLATAHASLPFLQHQLNRVHENLYTVLGLLAK